MNEGERKSLVSEVGGWIWGTIEGGFNEQQTISQIVVDAAIGMIPVVGDVTAVRDLIATILRLVEHPEKRKEKLERVTLVLLLFALLPIAGGAIKGVGRLLIEAGEEAGEHANLLKTLVAFLNRVGEGNAVKFLKGLDFESHAAEIAAKWRTVAKRLDDVLAVTLKHVRACVPAGMVRRLEQIQKGLRELSDLADRMIPDALKELNAKLKAVQQQLYAGEWHAIPESLRSTTRESEARLVEEARELRAKAAHLPFPPDGVEHFHPAPGWPDLGTIVNRRGKLEAIESFSGEIRNVYLPPGTKIRRVVEDADGKLGRYWVRELPQNGREWRREYAVLDDWSKDGSYIEFTVPEPGVWAWEGRTASQFQRDLSKKGAGQLLTGGGTQLFIDFRFPKHEAAVKAVADLSLIPTGWTDHMGVDVPAPRLVVEALSSNQLEPKMTRSAGSAERVTRSAENQQEQTPP